MATSRWLAVLRGPGGCSEPPKTSLPSAAPLPAGPLLPWPRPDRHQPSPAVLAQMGSHQGLQARLCSAPAGPRRTRDAAQAARQQQPNNKTKRSQRPGEPGFLSKNTTQRIFLCFLPAKARRAEEVIRLDFGNKHVDFKQQSKCKLRVSNHHLPSAPDFRKTTEITRCAWRIKATIKRAEFCLPVYQLFACVGVAAERRGSASRAPSGAFRGPGGRAPGFRPASSHSALSFRLTRLTQRADPHQSFGSSLDLPEKKSVKSRM